MAFWTIFLNYHLIASHHRTNVSVDTAKVLYAIQHDRQFDVGRIIFNQILSIGYDLRSLLYFPGLITHFCRQANIDEASEARFLVAPQQELKKKAYDHFCTRHGLPNLPTEGGRYRNRGIRGRGGRGGQGATVQPQQAAAAQSPQAVGRGNIPPQPFGGYPEVTPPWAQQLIHTVGDLREE